MENPKGDVKKTDRPVQIKENYPLHNRKIEKMPGRNSGGKGGTGGDCDESLKVAMVGNLEGGGESDVNHRWASQLLGSGSGGTTATAASAGGG